MNIKDEHLFYVISSWIFRSHNCLFFNNRTIMQKEMSFFSNTLPIDTLEVGNFYRAKLDIHGGIETKKFTGYNTKADLRKEIEDLRANYIMFNFQENFDSTDRPFNRARLILLQKDWEKISKKIKDARDNESVKTLNPVEFPNYNDELESWKNEALQEKKYSIDFIFVPGTYQSIFSDKNYLFEIKRYKYQYKDFDENILYGNSKLERALFFNELEKNDNSQNFDDSISYFDPFLLLNDQYKQAFTNFINILYEHFPEDKEQELAAFIIELFHIINFYFFQAVSAQQEYIVNSIFLHHSTNRKMTLSETISHMKKRIQEMRKESLYFFDTLCDYNTLDKLDTLIKHYKLKTINEDLIGRIIPFSASSHEELERLYNISYLLARLYKKTPLKEQVESALFNIKKLFADNNVPNKRKTHNFFSTFLNELIGTKNKARGDKKYLNDFYFQDLNNFLGGKKVYTKKLLQLFDFLNPGKLKGIIEEDESSHVLKKD